MPPYLLHVDTCNFFAFYLFSRVGRQEKEAAYNFKALRNHYDIFSLPAKIKTCRNWFITAEVLTRET